MLKQEENLWAISIEENGTGHEFFMELEKYPDPSIFLAKTPNAFAQSLPKNKSLFEKKLQAFSQESLSQKFSNSYSRWGFSWVIHCHRKPEAYGRSITSSQNVGSKPPIWHAQLRDLSWLQSPCLDKKRPTAKHHQRL